MKRPPTGAVSPSPAGFSLVEVVLAIGLLAFALLAIVGLLTVGMDAGSTSKELVRAVGLASQAVAERRQAPLIDSPTILLPPMTNSGTGSLLVAEDGSVTTDAQNAAFRLEWEYVHPTAPRGICYLTLDVLWPASAATTNAQSLRVASAVLLPSRP